MKRFILLSFVVLGLGFYELSGGSDFDPEAARLNVIEARQDRDVARKDALPGPVYVAAPASPAPKADDTVTRANLNLVSFASVVAEPEAPEVTAPIAAPRAADRDTDPEITVERLAAAHDEPLSLAALSPPQERPSNVFAGSSIVAASTDTSVEKTLRSVKGSRVNMRSGPGTQYDVVAQLTQSAEVEVLTDTGNGWVELRPLDGGPTGWVAEFLLTGG
ncbi:SH3 domain-containing protein [Roseobacter litoralis]|uniref:SH3 domain-containing protein n=1 Tax=Roseobacter litoralis TaxID=42443 RepID=UPI0024906A43|nr:SH3 domain-containing protein [Roseobacter litoralis]